jgi:hypothetical protein
MAVATDSGKSRRYVRPSLVRNERFPEGMQPVKNAPFPDDRCKNEATGL